MSKKPVIKFLLLFALFLPPGSKAVWSQPVTKAMISNVDFEVSGQKVLITYDIVQFRNKEKFFIKTEIYTAAGKKLDAKTLYGDVNMEVYGGNHKQIIWDAGKDSLFIDEDAYVEVSATSLYTAKTGKCLLLSAILPGLGDYTISPRVGYFLIGAAGYSCLLSSVLFNRKAAAHYEDYLNSLETSERKGFYSSAGAEKQLSTVFFMSAAGIWAADLVWVALKARRKIIVGYAYDPSLKQPLVSLKINLY